MPNAQVMSKHVKQETDLRMHNGMQADETMPA